MHHVSRYSYHNCNTDETSLPYRITKVEKQVLSLLPTLSEMQGETHAFLLNSNTEVMVT